MLLTIVMAAALCSMDSLEPAPTEEGYYLGGQIEKVLSELQEETDVMQPRRYSRSFSEPNLFQRALQACHHELDAFPLPSSLQDPYSQEFLEYKTQFPLTYTAAAIRVIRFMLKHS
jgi:hypothetical protein